MTSLRVTPSRTLVAASLRRAVGFLAVGALLVSACTTDDSDDFFPDGQLVPISTPAGEAVSNQPTPELPDERLNELVVTTLEEGTGRASQTGDTLIVDYVGVRSDDGSEFDSTYGFSPLMVTLGLNVWIEGWERGLLGVLEGERRQLDVPSELAYGAEGSGRGIGGDEDLTYVFDIRLIIPAADLSEAPTEPGVPLEGRSFETAVKTLAEGDGDLLEPSDTAIFRYRVFLGDEGTMIADGWTDVLFQDVDILPGLRNGMQGMAVGERRAITVPPEDGFGLDGSVGNGIPSETDIIYVVELVGIS